MGISERKVKGKGGKVTRSRIFTVYVDTGETYPSGRKKYKLVKRSIGPASEVSKTLAKEIYDRERPKYKRNKYAPNAPKLADFAEEYIDYVHNTVNKRSWWRDQYALNNLISYFGNVKLDSITVSHLHNYQDSRKGTGRSNGTINRELSILRRLYNVARIKGRYPGDNPVSGIQFLHEEQKIERVLSYEEEDKLMAASPYYLRPILLCALNTGMRKNEILTLEWINVDLKNNFIIVESRHTKTKRVRKIPINSLLRKVLIKLKFNNSTHVFLSSLKQPYKAQDSLKKSFNTAVRRAKIDKLRFHDLRHTAATRMIEAGADITDVAEALGHYDIRTTLRYAHPRKSVITAIEALASRDNQTNRQTKLNSD